MPRWSSLLAVASMTIIASHAAAQKVCRPWFKHPQVPAYYPPGCFALVSLEPDSHPVLIGNARTLGLELWRIGPFGSIDHGGWVSEGLSSAVFLAADFDGDGDSDIVAEHFPAETIHVFTNAGDTLVEGPGTHTPGLTDAYAAEDYDGDGLPDLLVGTDTEILLLRNAGDGTFSLTATVPFDGAYTVLPATLDSDGRRDLIVTSRNRITPFRQVADGSFEQLTPVTVNNPGDDIILAGDVNGDGITDILHEERRILLGDGLGGFAHAEPLDPRVDRLSLLADLDGDTDLDLLVNAHDPAGEFVAGYAMLNDGHGKLTLLEHGGIISQHPLAGFNLVADADQDGRPDLISQRTAIIDIRFGAGDGLFDDVPFEPYFASILRRASAGDIDGDGDLDVVAVGEDPEPAILVLTNDGTGVFSLAAAMAAPSTVYERTPLADFDADGDLDILAWTAEHGLWIYENTSNGYFSQVHILPHRAGEPAMVPLVAEINHAGPPEIVAGDAEGETTGYTVYINMGNWQFQRRFTPAPQADHVLAVKDFDNDGYDDLLCADTDDQADELQICYGRRFWNFSEPQPTRVFGDDRPYAMPGDFNGDGHLDFAAYGWSVPGVEIMTNQADGTFVQTAFVDKLINLRDPGVADFDGDGFDELVCANQYVSYTKAVILACNADGEVVRQTYFGNAIGPMLGSPVGDFDGDGATDILLVTRHLATDLGGLSMFYNQCPGAPCLPDTNHDGLVDTRDFTAYLADWADQRDGDCSAFDCSADLDRNGAVDSRDVVRFLGAWAAGC